MRPIPTSANRGDWSRLAADGINALQRQALDGLIVKSINDLPDPIAGMITLPANKVIMPSGTIDLGTNRLVLPSSSSIIGLDPARDGFVTNNASAAITSTDATANVILRSFFVHNSGGDAFSVTTTNDIHVNFYWVGALGCTFGTISGGRVSALEFCYLGAYGPTAPTGGVTFTGTINKVFVVNTPFEDLAAGVSAITLDSALVATFADIRGNFFKGTGGTAITAEVGYTVGDGLFTSNLIDTAVTPNSGVTGADVNWQFSDNTGARESYTLGRMAIDTPASTTFSAINTPVIIAGTTVGGVSNERFTHTSGRLTFTGRRRTLVSIVVSCYITCAGNNKEYTTYASKNGVPITTEGATALVKTGGDKQTVTVNAVIELDTNDYVEVFTEALTDTTAVEYVEATVLIRG